MIAKKHFFLYFFSVFCLVSYAQISESKTFNLKWNDESTIRIDEETSLKVPLVEGNFFDEHNLDKKRNNDNKNIFEKIVTKQYNFIKLQNLQYSKLG